MKIAFFAPQIDVRGTSVATYDYAHFNETILKHESIIIHNRVDPRNITSAVERFKSRFYVDSIEIENISNEYYKENGQKIRNDLDEILQRENCDAMYVLKGGGDDGLYSDKFPTFVHCTGYQNVPHGTVYAYVSNHVNNTVANGKFPVVPHMINIPEHNENLRSELEIPIDFTVFGRSGGIDTWNLPFASHVVEVTLQHRKDVVFLFQNTPKFIRHPRVFFLESNPSVHFKTKFINTCDALLHARMEGESFGLTCGEFSIRNKPVITWLGSPEKNHIEVLGSKGMYYMTPDDLFNILMKFKLDKSLDHNFNCYNNYLPEPVMEKFHNVFCRSIK
jgi:hypothetical protein